MGGGGGGGGGEWVGIVYKIFHDTPVVMSFLNSGSQYCLWSTERLKFYILAFHISLVMILLTWHRDLQNRLRS